MNLLVERINIEHIPTLVVVDETKRNKMLPTVVYYHGFNGEKESSLTLAYKIAQKGIRVVLPESIHHGERKQNLSAEEIQLSFWDIVVTNIKELEIIRQFLMDNNLLLDGKIGVGGTSMGGITTYGALRSYDWIQTAAVLMGNPYMTKYAKVLIERYENGFQKKIEAKEIEKALSTIEQYDVTKNIDTLANRPLFIWHGDLDQIVPIEHTRSFYEIAVPHYKNDENLVFLEEKGRMHNISKLSMDESAHWFDKHLNK